jgi:hypothetical protein
VKSSDRRDKATVVRDSRCGLSGAGLWFFLDFVTTARILRV